MTHVINGQWCEGEGEEFQSFNPVTQQVLWQGKAASASQVDQAVQAARQAQYAWFSVDLAQRTNVIKAFQRELEAEYLGLAKLISAETGKPLWESRTEVDAMIAKIDVAIAAYHERTGFREQANGAMRAVLRHKPHGVIAVLGPFNFPGHLPNGHIIPALLAGNTLVFKPSELTPKVAEFTLLLWLKAGLPEGVLNLVQGQQSTGQALAGHAQIDGLLFTGSSRTGLALHRQFSESPSKILALEMGGNNPLLVAEVTDEQAAVHHIIQSAFITSGQRCTCARRLLLPKSAQGERLLARLIEATANIAVGNPNSSPEPFMGSMISKAAAQSLLKTQQQLVDLGGRILLPLTLVEAESALVSAGIIDVSQITSLPDEEYFGPLLQVQRYGDFNEAIELANNTRFGLAAGLLSDDPNDWDEFIRRSRAGIVNWNRPTTGASGSAPFGGVGDSGNHRASAYYAADYCAYPVASMESEQLSMPAQLPPGLTL